MKTFIEVSEAAELDGITAIRYVAYMTRRWSEEEETQCATGYALEWATKFKDGREYECSDGEGKMVLGNIDRSQP